MCPLCLELEVKRLRGIIMLLASALASAYSEMHTILEGVRKP